MRARGPTFPPGGARRGLAARAGRAVERRRRAPRAPARGLPRGVELHALPALGDEDEGCLRRGRRRCGPDVRRRGPGAEEDRQGLPFVGRAGQLLSELLAGIGLSRDDVFITNVLKSRPPGNRDPQPAEIEACHPYLMRQVELIEPRVIATLGNFATKLITGSRVGITRVRGTSQVHEIAGRTVFVMPLLHPAAALRTPSLVETLQGDFRTLSELVQQKPPTSETPDATAAEPEPNQLGLFGG